MQRWGVRENPIFRSAVCQAPPLAASEQDSHQVPRHTALLLSLQAPALGNPEDFMNRYMGQVPDKDRQAAWGSACTPVQRGLSPGTGEWGQGALGFDRGGWRQQRGTSRWAKRLLHHHSQNSGQFVTVSTFLSFPRTVMQPGREACAGAWLRASRGQQGDGSPASTLTCPWPLLRR